MAWEDNARGWQVPFSDHIFGVHCDLFVCQEIYSHIPEGEGAVCFVHPQIVTHLHHCTS